MANLRNTFSFAVWCAKYTTKRERYPADREQAIEEYGKLKL